MKKFFLSLAGAAMLLGSVAIVPEPAMAAGMHNQRHHHRVCRIVVKKKVVWRHHHRHIVRYKVRQCHWSRW